ATFRVDTCLRVPREFHLSYHRGSGRGFDRGQTGLPGARTPTRHSQERLAEETLQGLWRRGPRGPQVRLSPDLDTPPQRDPSRPKFRGPDRERWLSAQARISPVATLVAWRSGRVVERWKPTGSRPSTRRQPSQFHLAGSGPAFRPRALNLRRVF